MITPVVRKLPPVTFPVALACPPVFKFCPKILPATEINPAVRKLPPLTLPVTLTLPNVPTVVKLAVKTFELRVFPVSVLAGTLAVTPVRAAPLPIKTLPETLPVALILPVFTVVPVMVTPVPDTTITLATPVLDILMVEFATIAILLLPF